MTPCSKRYGNHSIGSGNPLPGTTNGRFEAPFHGDKTYHPLPGCYHLPVGAMPTKVVMPIWSRVWWTNFNSLFPVQLRGHSGYPFRNPLQHRGTTSTLSAWRLLTYRSLYTYLQVPKVSPNLGVGAYTFEGASLALSLLEGEPEMKDEGKSGEGVDPIHFVLGVGEGGSPPYSRVSLNQETKGTQCPMVML